jgi:CIC family chloride channel protein
MHAPQVLRALVRADEIWLVVLAAFIGCASGFMVWLMTTTTQFVHETLFLIGHSDRLSAMASLNPLRTVLVPAVGGLVLGAVSLGIGRLRSRRTVDPIEANALFGGRMSLSGSLIVVLQTIMSGTPRSGRLLPRAGGTRSGCGATICACWWAVAPPRRSPARSTPR